MVTGGARVLMAPSRAQILRLHNPGRPNFGGELAREQCRTQASCDVSGMSQPTLRTGAVTQRQVKRGGTLVRRQLVLRHTRHALAC